MTTRRPVRIDETILSLEIHEIGEPIDVNYTGRDGNPATFVKYEIMAVDNANGAKIKYDANASVRQKIVVGGKYEAGIQFANDRQYPSRLVQVTPVSADAPPAVQDVQAEPSSPEPPRATPSSPSPSPTSPNPSPDLVTRTKEHWTSARGAHFAAMDGLKVISDLLIAGKLHDGEGNVIEGMTIRQIHSEYDTLVDRYWGELRARIVQDSYGYFGGDA